MDCNFCKKIFDSLETTPNVNCIIKYGERFDIQAVAADPYDCGWLDGVKYCPYCGRELKGEQ